MEEKSIGFTLFVDEEMGDALTVLFNVFREEHEHNMKHHPEMALDDGYLKLTDSIRKLVETVSTKTHQLGWCKDKNCEWSEEDKGRYI